MPLISSDSTNPSLCLYSSIQLTNLMMILIFELKNHYVEDLLAPV